MAVYFSSDERFISADQRLYKLGQDGGGQLIYGKEPIPPHIGPGFYFDKDNDYKRNWNAKIPKTEPMSRGAPKRATDEEKRLRSMMPSWIVMTGANYQRAENPGPGSYTPYKDSTYGESNRSRGGNRPNTASSSRSRRPGTATSTSSRPGSSSARVRSRPGTAGTPKSGRFPSGQIRDGVYFSDNRMDDGLPQGPGPGSYNLENTKTHFQRAKSHNCRGLLDGKKSLVKLSTYQDSELRKMQLLAMSAPTKSENRLGEASEYNIAGDGSHSSVSLSMSEQMALVS